MERGKYKEMLRILSVLFFFLSFSDLPKFIILSHLSHTQDPFSVSSKPIPPFAVKLHCFLSHSAAAVVASFLHNSNKTTVLFY